MATKRGEKQTEKKEEPAGASSFQLIFDDKLSNNLQPKVEPKKQQDKIKKGNKGASELIDEPLQSYKRDEPSEQKTNKEM